MLFPGSELDYAQREYRMFKENRILYRMAKKSHRNECVMYCVPGPNKLLFDCDRL